MSVSYYIVKDGEQAGPFDEQELRKKIDTGEISFYDLCWCAGMSNWSPIRETLKFDTAQAPPTPPPPMPETSGLQFQEKINPESLRWEPTIFSAVAVTFFSVLLFIAERIGPEDMVLLSSVLLLISLIPAIIFWCLLHLNLWRMVKIEYRFTSPGRAVGFTFIPIFNFYWAFITWPKLVEGLQKSGYRLPESAGISAIALAILNIAGWTIAFVPFLGVLTDIGSLVALTVFYVNTIESLKTSAPAGDILQPRSRRNLL